jgi:hypothetical protein
MGIGGLIGVAIANKKIIEFDYHGHHRIAEPHVYGIHEGKEQVLVYQIGGTSSTGGIPEWRRMDVSEITNLEVSEKVFAGPRPTQSGKHTNFDKMIAVVK